MAVEWPDVEEAVNLLNIGDEVWIQEHLTHALDAAIAAVKRDAGLESEDEPDEELRQAALRAVQVLRVNAPDDGWRALRQDRIYMSLLHGHRKTFGIA